MNVIVVCFDCCKNMRQVETGSAAPILQRTSVVLKKSAGYERRAPSVYLPGRDRRGISHICHLEAKLNKNTYLS